MVFFDLLKNCLHPIPGEKLAGLVSIAFVRGSQSVRTAMVLIAAMVSVDSAAPLPRTKRTRCKSQLALSRTKRTRPKTVCQCSGQSGPAPKAIWRWRSQP